jgi:hypothetical protein
MVREYNKFGDSQSALSVESTLSETPRFEYDSGSVDPPQFELFGPNFRSNITRKLRSGKRTMEVERDFSRSDDSLFPSKPERKV